MQSKSERLAMIKASADRFKKLKAQEARFVREEKRKVESDERYWTDASSYADQYYGDVYRATTRLDNDWD